MGMDLLLKSSRRRRRSCWSTLVVLFILLMKNHRFDGIGVYGFREYETSSPTTPRPTRPTFSPTAPVVPTTREPTPETFSPTLFPTRFPSSSPTTSTPTLSPTTEQPTISLKPTSSPTTSQPTISLAPTRSPTPNTCYFFSGVWYNESSIVTLDCPSNTRCGKSIEQESICFAYNSAQTLAQRCNGALSCFRTSDCGLLESCVHEDYCGLGKCFPATVLSTQSPTNQPTTNTSAPTASPLTSAPSSSIQLAASDLLVWQMLYDNSEGAQWISCSDTRNNPCNCRQVSSNHFVTCEDSSNLPSLRNQRSLRDSLPLLPSKPHDFKLEHLFARELQSQSVLRITEIVLRNNNLRVNMDKVPMGSLLFLRKLDLGSDSNLAGGNIVSTSAVVECSDFQFCNVPGVNCEFSGSGSDLCLQSWGVDPKILMLSSGCALFVLTLCCLYFLCFRKSKKNKSKNSARKGKGLHDDDEEEEDDSSSKGRYPIQKPQAQPQQGRRPPAVPPSRRSQTYESQSEVLVGDPSSDRSIKTADQGSSRSRKHSLVRNSSRRLNNAERQRLKRVESLYESGLMAQEEVLMLVPDFFELLERKRAYSASSNVKWVDLEGQPAPNGPISNIVRLTDYDNTEAAAANNDGQQSEYDPNEEVHTYDVNGDDNDDDDEDDEDEEEYARQQQEQEEQGESNNNGHDEDNDDNDDDNSENGEAPPPPPPPISYAPRLVQPNNLQGTYYDEEKSDEINPDEYVEASADMFEEPDIAPPPVPEQDNNYNNPSSSHGGILGFVRRLSGNSTGSNRRGSNTSDRRGSNHSGKSSSSSSSYGFMSEAQILALLAHAEETGEPIPEDRLPAPSKVQFMLEDGQITEEQSKLLLPGIIGGGVARNAALARSIKSDDRRDSTGSVPSASGIPKPVVKRDRDDSVINQALSFLGIDDKARRRRSLSKLLERKRKLDAILSNSEIFTSFINEYGRFFNAEHIMFWNAVDRYERYRGLAVKNPLAYAEMARGIISDFVVDGSPNQVGLSEAVVMKLSNIPESKYTPDLFTEAKREIMRAMNITFITAMNNSPDKKELENIVDEFDVLVAEVEERNRAESLINDVILPAQDEDEANLDQKEIPPEVYETYDDDEKVNVLMGLGYSRRRSIKSLVDHNGDVELAAQTLILNDDGNDDAHNNSGIIDVRKARLIQSPPPRRASRRQSKESVLSQRSLVAPPPGIAVPDVDDVLNAEDDLDMANNEPVEEYHQEEEEQQQQQQQEHYHEEEEEQQQQQQAHYHEEEEEQQQYHEEQDDIPPPIPPRTHNNNDESGEQNSYEDDQSDVEKYRTPSIDGEVVDPTERDITVNEIVDRVLPRSQSQLKWDASQGVFTYADDSDQQHVEEHQPAYGSEEEQEPKHQSYEQEHQYSQEMMNDQTQVYHDQQQQQVQQSGYPQTQVYDQAMYDQSAYQQGYDQSAYQQGYDQSAYQQGYDQSAYQQGYDQTQQGYDQAAYYNQDHQQQYYDYSAAPSNQAYLTTSYQQPPPQSTIVGSTGASATGNSSSSNQGYNYGYKNTYEPILFGVNRSNSPPPKPRHVQTSEGLVARQRAYFLQKQQELSYRPPKPSKAEDPVPKVLPKKDSSWKRSGSMGKR